MLRIDAGKLGGLLLAVSMLVPGALASSTCGPDGLQASGSIYRICMPAPEDYNGSLVLWAHGFQDAGMPVQIPEDQLTIGDTSLPELINTLGFGFATNSYSKTGLAVRQGVEDLLDLVQIYDAEQGTPDHVFVVGASEGGIITARLVEGHPEVFDGGLAACGPVGSFPYQINYFGNARVTFEFFFPGLIPGNPFFPPPDLAQNWSAYYDQNVQPVVFDPANADKLDQWARVASLPSDPNDYLGSLEVSVADVLRYAVVNSVDAAVTLGGFPFDNRYKWYHGSDNDLLLNILVPRISASPVALAEMQAHYSTSGALDVPLITLHTRLDQQVPYFHEVLYALKTINAGTFGTKHINIPIDRFGHCNFTVGEAVVSFVLMLERAGWPNAAREVDSRLDATGLSRVEEMHRESSGHAPAHGFFK